MLALASSPYVAAMSSSSAGASSSTAQTSTYNYDAAATRIADEIRKSVAKLSVHEWRKKWEKPFELNNRYFHTAQGILIMLFPSQIQSIITPRGESGIGVLNIYDGTDKENAFIFEDLKRNGIEVKFYAPIAYLPGMGEDGPWYEVISIDGNPVPPVVLDEKSRISNLRITRDFINRNY